MTTVPKCPKCGKPPTGTVEHITGIAHIDWNDDGYVYTGETEVDWNSQHSVEDDQKRLLFHCGQCREEFFAAGKEA